MDVDRAQQVVEQQNVAVGVERTGEGDTGLLAARQRGSLLTDHCLVAVGEELEVALETGVLYGLFVACGVEALSEDNVILDGVVDDPRLLSDETHRSVDSHLRASETLLELHFSQ